MDIQGSIARGQDFAQAIDAALNSCDVALVIIGKHWATSTGPDGNLRLEDPNDWVRVEIAAVLRRNVLVIPVLIDGARLPNPASLPEELRPLCRRNVCELTDSRWSYDVGELAKDIHKIVRPPKTLEMFSPRNNASHWLLGAVIALTVLIGIWFFGSNGAWIMQSIPGAMPTTAQRVLGPISQKHRDPTAIDAGNPASSTGTPTTGPASLPGPSLGGHPTQDTRNPDVVAELTRFVRAENLITAEVAFKNTGSEAAKFCFGYWKLIDEKTSDTSSPNVTGGDADCYPAKTLAPGATHVAWAKFKSDASSSSKYSLDIQGILNRPFEGLALTSPR
jgi:TIR domain